MTLEIDQPFTKQHEKKKVDTFTIRFNPEERKKHEENKKILHQPKDSTALKQLAEIGENVIHDPKMRAYLEIILENQRKNKERGIVDFIKN